ncbi:MAG TPA: DNA-processing protein DprA [Candidatus Limnocylindrales bacterium]
MDEATACAVLTAAPGVGPATLTRLLAAVGSGLAVLELATSRRAKSTLLDVLGPDGGVAAEGVVAIAATAEDCASLLLRSELTILLVTDPGYPALLRATRDPPAVLFVRGTLDVLSASHIVAVVGTRRPTEGGRRIAGRIAAGIAGLDGVIVSGLAVGIDGAAHAAAVAMGGLTIAILGGGHDQLYPRTHARLADEIAARGGAVVSESAPWVRPARWSFPQRNRIISGLSAATIVVEAGIGSGALITAKSALEQGRAVFVVPGPLDVPTSAGCLALLRSAPDATRIVAGVPELLVDLELTTGRRGSGPNRSEAALAEAGVVEREVATLVATGVGTVDALVAATELPVATVLAALTMLETRGLVLDALGRYRPAGALVASAGRRRRQPNVPAGRAPPLPW